jgi:hypothetical protein
MMSETSTIQQDKRTATKIAKASLVFAIIGLVCVIAGPFFECEGGEPIPSTLYLITFFCITISFLLSITAIVVIFLCLLGEVLLLPKQGRIGGYAMKVMCEGNFHEISKALYIYADDNGGRFPDPNKWCDLLADKYIYKESLECPAARKHHDNGPCNYAMNPYCQPNSPPDTVLLFETKGGWNQYGGSEIAAFFHKCETECHVMFKGKPSEFIKREDINKLRWKAEDVNNIK